MKLSRVWMPFLFMAVAASTASAQAIWKWRDLDGHVEVSDRPPPSNIPEKNILTRPGAHASLTPSVNDAEPMPASAPSGVDKELEARKRKLQQDQDAKKQAQADAEKQRINAQKAENCQRARNQLAMLQSGVRVASPDAAGQRIIMDDAKRAQETQRTQQQINDNCN
jgi:hypothetical protein